MKTRSLHTTALTLMLSLAGAEAQCLQPPADLVGWWPGNGSYLDRAGTSHATPHNGLTFTNGFVDLAFLFNSQPQNYLTVPLNTSYNCNKASGDYTIAAWVNPSSLAWECLFNNGQWTLFFYQGMMGFARLTEGNPFHTEAGQIPANQWTHIAVTRNGDTYRLWVNGSVAQETSRSDIPASSSALMIGADTFGAYYDGAMDEVLIFNHGLATNEMAAIYGAGSAGLCWVPFPTPPGLISWWRGEGNTHDSTGVHPGTAHGALSYTNGQVGQCFVLDGDSGAVELGGGWFNLQQFTWSLWVNPGDSQMAYADLLDNYHTSWLSWPIQYQNFQEGGFSRWQWGPNGGGVITFDMRVGAWQHLVVARDGTIGTTLYLNGSVVGTKTGYAPIPYDGSEFLYLGRHAIFGRYFKGWVDEVMIFSQALSAADVASLYLNQGGRPPLGIQNQTGSLQLTWPILGTNFVLETSVNLATNNWQTVTNSIVPSGNFNTVLVPISDSMRFFRLRSSN